MTERTENRKRFSLRVAKVTAERLQHDADRHGWTVSALLNEIVEERYGLRERCPSEVFRGSFYSCVWGRQKTTPKILKLAETVQEKNDICRACARTLDLVMRAETAEAMATMDRIIELPFCSGGGEMRENKDGSHQLFCMLSPPHKWVEINHCKTRKYGKPCEGYKTTQITVQGTQPKDMK